MTRKKIKSFFSGLFGWPIGYGFFLVCLQQQQPKKKSLKPLPFMATIMTHDLNDSIYYIYIDTHTILICFCRQQHVVCSFIVHKYFFTIWFMLCVCVCVRGSFISRHRTHTHKWKKFIITLTKNQMNAESSEMKFFFCYWPKVPLSVWQIMVEWTEQNKTRKEIIGSREWNVSNAKHSFFLAFRFVWIQVSNSLVFFSPSHWLAFPLCLLASLIVCLRLNGLKIEKSIHSFIGHGNGRGQEIWRKKNPVIGYLYVRTFWNSIYLPEYFRTCSSFSFCLFVCSFTIYNP